MGNIICASCKEEGFSKCPHCRNSFMEDAVKEYTSTCDHKWKFKPGQKSSIGCDCPKYYPELYKGETR